MSDPFELAAQAATELAARTQVPRHDIVVILGSAWGNIAAALPAGVDVPMSDLTGFVHTSVTGHRALLRSCAVGDRRVLIAFGRVHLYEGHAPAVVAHAVRTAAAAGCTTAIITNAAGSIDPSSRIGDVVVITDHINFTGASPLTGLPGNERFVSMIDAYSPHLRSLAQRVDPTLGAGVYVGLHGPEFETPAEIRAFAGMGAHLVGMSTVIETIAARHAGVEVLGLSLVTNLAAGVGPDFGAEDVFSVASSSAERLGRLLTRLLDALA